jgi:hypothetical protein
VPSWRFSPDTIHVSREWALAIVNRGGEVHTFTEVAEFGGGIIPDLNALAGTPVPAPECSPASLVFIPAGGQTSHTFEPGGADKYQCCIHPWMRADPIEATSLRRAHGSALYAGDSASTVRCTVRQSALWP